MRLALTFLNGNIYDCWREKLWLKEIIMKYSV